MNVDILLGACGRVFLVFHVSILNNCAEFVECYKHPYQSGVTRNLDTSLVAYPNILCWSDEHLRMLPVTLIGFILYCVLGTALVVWVVYQAPMRFSQAKFVRRYGFIMLKFRPNRWYWAVFIFVRNTLLAFTVTIAPDRPGLQAILFCLVLLVFLCLNSAFQPWREPSYNALELAGISLISAFTLAALPLAPRDGSTTKEVSFILSFAFIVGGSFAAFVVIQGSIDTIKKLKRPGDSKSQMKPNLEVAPFTPGDSAAPNDDVLSARDQSQLTKIDTGLLNGLRKVATWLQSRSRESLVEIVDCMNIYDKKTCQQFVEILVSGYMKGSAGPNPFLATRVVQQNAWVADPIETKLSEHAQTLDETLTSVVAHEARQDSKPSEHAQPPNASEPTDVKPDHDSEGFPGSVPIK
jgi:hypothetical protein